jgi:transketolase
MINDVLDERSMQLRRLCVEALFGGDRGHLGSTFSLVEILRVLFDFKVQDDPKNLILSKGHGCVALYAILAEKGFISVESLKSFCQFNSKLGGHPDSRKIDAVQFSTGSLGHGVGYGAGLALARRIKNNNDPLYCIVGDGEINEGSFWEALMSVAKHRLGNYCIIVDRNFIQSAGTTEAILPLKNLEQRVEAIGFCTATVNGHDVHAIKAALDSFDQQNSPSFLIAETTKGKGIDFAEGDPNWHHQTSFSDEVKLAIMEQLK